MAFHIVTSKILSVSIILGSIASFATEARADWGNEICTIENASSDALLLAVKLYNEPEAAQRGCLTEISFTAPQTINMTRGIAFTQAPLAGRMYGTGMGRCFSEADQDCPPMSDTDVVLHFAGYTDNEGKCPIRIAEGANISIFGFKIVAPVPELAICHYGADEAIPFNDKANPYAYISGVTVEKSLGVPPIDSVPAESTSCSASGTQKPYSTGIFLALIGFACALRRRTVRRIH